VNTISVILLIYSMLSSKTPISLPGKLTSNKNYYFDILYNHQDEDDNADELDVVHEPQDATKTPLLDNNDDEDELFDRKEVTRS